jgi:hypothetical protein
MNSLKYIFYFIAIFLFFLTCKKREKLDLSTIQTYHHLAIPLVNAQIGIEELLKKDTGGLVTTNPQTGEILLAYESSAMSIDASEIIDIIDQTFSASIPAGPTSIIPVGSSIDTTITFNQSFVVPNGEELDSIDFSSGVLDYSITNNLRHEVEVTIKIPSLVSKLLPITYSDFTSVDSIGHPTGNIKTGQTALSNYIFDLTKGNLGYNQIAVEFIVKIKGSGASVTSAEDLNIVLSMNGLEFARIDGDLKYQKFDLGSSPVTLSIFNISDGAFDFSLTNPKIEHTIVNSFGFSANMGMDSMYYEDLSGIKIDDIKYDSTGLSPKIAPFYFPSIQQPINAFDSATTIIFMDNTNSSISSLINATPKTIISKPFVEVNLAPTASNNNYILSSSKISVSTEISLPLEGYAQGWIMKDTIPFNAKVDELFSSETSIDSAIIKFTTTNYFPLDVKIDLILLDSTSTTIDTIADSELIIASGVIDANGKITTAQAVPTKLPCDGTCVDNLNNTRFIILRLSIGTTGVSSQESVKIYDDYKIELDIALLISGRMF